MAWPTRPQFAADIPQQTVADVDLFQHAAPVLDEVADGALCELVADCHGLLELITEGDAAYEKKFGTAMLVAASLGPLSRDPSGYVDRVATGHDLPIGVAPEAAFVRCLLTRAIMAGKPAIGSTGV